MGRAKPKLHILVECDRCDMYHPEGFTGRCWHKDTRFETVEDYAERMGVDRKHIVVQPFLPGTPE